MQPHEEEKCHVVNVVGDGNCFYRAVQVLLGFDEDDYMPLKEMVYEFAHENIELTFESGDAFDILNRIGKDGDWAMFEDVFLTANML